MPRSRRVAVFLSVVILALALDQGSKAWARTLPVQPAGCSTGDLIAHRCGGVPRPVIAGYWDWELAMNDGAAFSSLAGGSLPQLVFAAIAALAVLAIGVAATRARPDERPGWSGVGVPRPAGPGWSGVGVPRPAGPGWSGAGVPRPAGLTRVAFGLVASGALGNMIDRVHQGAVTDFVRWHVHDHVWPIFNVADAALLIGVGLLFLDRALAHRTKSRDPEVEA